MTGVAKPTPIEAFELNFNDASWLIQTATVLQNQRARRMRKELRSSFGVAMRLPDRDHDLLDCVESEDLFVVIKPRSSITRAHVSNLDPLLRQAIVAGSAALETYVADAVCARVGLSIRTPGDLPRRLGELTMSISDWKYIEDRYDRRRRGLRENVLVPTIRELSSTAPNQIGILLSMLGIDQWAKKVDGHRRIEKGETVRQLEALTARRNRIAHSGDRRGYGRLHITVAEATGYMTTIEEVARAIEKILSPVAREDTE